MREADRTAIKDHGFSGLVLMENAARGACDMLAEFLEGLEGKRIAVLCGKGNNGGDGLGLARHATLAGAGVTCLLMHPEGDLSPDAAAQAGMLGEFDTITVVRWDGASEEHLNNGYDAIVDALLGTGATGALQGDYRAAVDWANNQECFRFALDVPTGLNADTGLTEGDAFVADATATMGALKPGLLLNKGLELAGEIHIIHIGALPPKKNKLFLLEGAAAASLLPPVHPARHKYGRGKVLVVAGSVGMAGAGVLASHAALRAGAGLVVYAMPELAAKTLTQSVQPEVMTRFLPSVETGSLSLTAFDAIADAMKTCTTVAVGPGLSRESGAMELARKLVATSTLPLVLDADGLNAFEGRADELGVHSCPLVITPHYGEMARITGIEKDVIAANPVWAARQAATRFNAIVALKGAPTVVAFPDGRAWINDAGNPGMATGGAGDVLTGVIASLIGQTGTVEAATLLGVYLHSIAGDIAADSATEYALTANDIIASIPAAYKHLLELQ